MTTVTIATHNRSYANRDHNIRGKSTDNQPHINKDGIHEVWVDEKPRIAYDRLFGESVAEYNARQKRADRQIDDYFTKIVHDRKKNPVYEMIIGVYGDVPEDVGKQIMRDFAEHWKDRNPNLELIGAYYHADEEGQPHVHLDYIPVATGYTRGMKVQNGLAKALEHQGFVKEGKKTAQILWEQSENQVLENICLNYGFEVIHPQKDKGIEHIHTEAYKASMELQKAQEELLGLKDDINTLEGDLIALEAEHENCDNAIRQKEDEINYLQNITNLFTQDEDMDIDHSYVFQGEIKSTKSIPVLERIASKFKDKIHKLEESFNDLWQKVTSLTQQKEALKAECDNLSLEYDEKEEELQQVGVLVSEATRLDARDNLLGRYYSIEKKLLDDEKEAFRKLDTDAMHRCYGSMIGNMHRDRYTVKCYGELVELAEEYKELKLKPTTISELKEQVELRQQEELSDGFSL